MFIDPLLLAFFVLNHCLALFGLRLTDRYLQLSHKFLSVLWGGLSCQLLFSGNQNTAFLSAFPKVRTDLH